MEYDPASPTDEPEDPPPKANVDISAIPLPGSPCLDAEQSPTNLTDIPLPPGTWDASTIPLPPLPAKVEETEIRPPDNDSDIKVSRLSQGQDGQSGHLKFSIKAAPKPLTGQDAPNEASSIFESSKDLKSDGPRSMPKLQAMMKRSRPVQLPVGVLPSKNKIPATEAKTELFLPSKESEPNSSNTAGLESAKAAQAAALIAAASLQAMQKLQTAESGDMAIGMKDTVLLTQTSTSFAPSVACADSIAGDLKPNLQDSSSILPSTISGNNSTSSANSTSHIPNLMSLSVSPVQSTTTLSQSAPSAESAAALLQTQVNMANMQYVNPQKLRSAQMIATPLIANPAVAAQSHQTAEEQQRSKDNRHRSRSRSRRRSHSRRRSSPRRNRRRYSSSSSDSSSPRHLGRRYQRRSRSRRTSGDRHPRDHVYPRNRERDKRELEVHKERKAEQDDGHARRDGARDKTTAEKRASIRKSPSEKERKRPRRQSDQREQQLKSKTDRDRHEPDSKKPLGGRGRATRDVNERRDTSRRSPSSRNQKNVSDKRPSQSSKPVDIKRDPQQKSVVKKVQPKSSSGTLADLVRPTSSRGGEKGRPSRPKSREPSSSGSESSASESSGSRPSPRHRPSKVQPSTHATDKRSSSEESNSSSSSASSKKSTSPDKTPPRRAVLSSRDSACKDTKVLSNRESQLSTVPVRSNNAGIGPSQNVGGLRRIGPEDGCEDMDLGSDVELESAFLDNLEIPDDTQSCAGGELLATVNDLFASVSTPTGSNSPPYIDVKDLKPATTSSQGITGRSVSSRKLDSISGSITADDRAGHLCASEKSESRGPSDSHVPDAPSLERQVEAKYDLRKRRSKQDLFGCSIRPPAVARSDSHPIIPPAEVFNAFPEAPKPQYTHILTNDYSFVDGPVSSHSGVTGASLVGCAVSANSASRHEMRRWICDCTLPSLEEINLGILSCGPGCINRALNIECGPFCPTGQFCSNRQFQEHMYAPTEPFYCGPNKGWGLRATATVKKNSFIVEYVGEVINFSEFRRRVRRYERQGHAHHYFMAIEPDRFIDAGTKGNWARFVNHSCEPNCVTQKWSVDGRIRIGFFARQEIAAGEEITIDYQFVQFGLSEQKCYCAAPSCSGVMGTTSKNLQEKMCLKDTAMVERRVMKLLQLGSFKSAEDITLLLQVLVQECLTRYTRFELLKRLAATEADECLKLFRQYNGLDMLAALMCDSLPEDWLLKRQILICLDKIPVSEQKQVQSNSRLMDIVTQWTTDPRYCRPRGTTLEERAPATCSDNSGEFSERPTDSGGKQNEVTESQPGIQNLTSVLSSAAADAKHPEDNTYSDTENRPTKLLTRSGAVPLNGDSCISSPNSTPSSSVSPTTTRSSVANDSQRSHSLNTPIESFPATMNGEEELSDSPLHIDEETGEVEPSSLSNVESNDGIDSPVDEATHAETPQDVDENGGLDREVKAEVMSLASRLIERWSKLPWEVYRIPRLERQETEKMLHIVSQPDSSLVSWGYNDESKSPTNTWGCNISNSAVPNRAKRSNISDGVALPSKFSFCGRELTGTSSMDSDAITLSKAERRRLFEAKVFAAEAEKKENNTISGDVDVKCPTDDAPRVDLKTPIGEVAKLYFKSPIGDISNISNAQEADRLRQLILCSLLSELNKKYSSVSNAETCSEADIANAKIILTTLLQTLPHLLSKLSTSPDVSNITRMCEELTRRTVVTPPSLPSGWQSAIDPSGRTYYYNMETKVVQWEQPTLGDKNPVTSKSPSMDAKDRKKAEKDFTVEVGDYILRLLRPYRLPNCLTGRIESKSDLIHITRKFTYAFTSKELKRTRSLKYPPSLTSSFSERIRTSLTRYMMSRGPIYKRHQKSTPQPMLDCPKPNSVHPPSSSIS